MSSPALSYAIVSFLSVSNRTFSSCDSEQTLIENNLVNASKFSGKTSVITMIECSEFKLKI